MTVQQTERERQEGGLGRYFRDAFIEMRRVVWPTQQETTRLTMIVIGVAITVGLLLGGADLLFSYIIQALV